jgi:Uncharacterized conserved protein
MPTTQVLKLADHLIGQVPHKMSGNTIRTGHRPIMPGPLSFESVSGSLRPVEVMVDSVRHATAAELTMEEIVLNGSADRDAFMEDMRAFYPDFSPDSDVTVVAWSRAGERP